MDSASDVLQKVRKFSMGELVGREAELDSLAQAPLPLYSTFIETGLANWWLPKSLGGLGLPLEDSVDIAAELAYGDAGASFTLFISILGTSIVTLYGNSKIKKTYLEPLATRGGFCATLGSELDAGSELTRIGTTVSRSGNELVVNGDKYFSTNTDFADFLVVITRSQENPTDYVAILIPRDTPGVHINKRWDVMGVRSSATYQVTFRDCRVPAENALNGHGLRLLEVGLNPSRILIASTAIGIAQRIRDLCLDYARAKEIKGKTLAENSVFANKLGHIEMQIEVMKNQCRTAAAEYDEITQGSSAAKDLFRLGTVKSALIAKMFCGQAGWQIASMGSEMFGELGYTHDTPIGKLLRDMRYVSVVEGGDDVLRDLIYSRYVLPASART